MNGRPGAVRAGQVEPGRVLRWVTETLGRKPKLDPETLSDTLLRYKGAEAGDVDWRPTETILEDYVAY